MDSKLKVRCIDEANGLTIGEIYTARRENDEWFVLDFDDTPYPNRFWYASRFEVISEEEPEVTSVRSTQVGGNHYTKLKIQPFEYINANDIGFNEGTAIAYLSRWKDKGGVQDLKKAVHSIEWLIEYEEMKLKGNS